METQVFKITTAITLNTEVIGPKNLTVKWAPITTFKGYTPVYLLYAKQIHEISGEFIDKVSF